MNLFFLIHVMRVDGLIKKKILKVWDRKTNGTTENLPASTCLLCWVWSQWDHRRIWGGMSPLQRVLSPLWASEWSLVGWVIFSFLCPFPFSRNLSHQNLWSQGLTGNPGAQPDWEQLRSVIREHSEWGGVLNPHFNSCTFLGRQGLEMHTGFSTLRYIARWKTEEVL